MKHFIFAFTLLFATAGSVFSQVEVRPFAGVNFSDVTETPEGQSSKAKLGAQLGASVMIGNQLYLNPGIAWFSRSTQYSQVGAADIDQTINGVIIPIHVGYRFVDPTTSPFLNFRIFAGPSLMFLTKTEFSDGALNEEVDWQDTQWGAQAGIGIDISMFFIDAGYEWALSNAATNSRGDLGVFNDIRNNTFFVNVGVRLTLAQ
ncbi:MAG: outer membrane beta-barrel protein [Cryomorphaceae bacterium]|nr:PorT family protein [Flavobacteriales bacterium]